MNNPNININVGGPQKASSTYETVILKGNKSFASQVTKPNIKYVIKYDFDLGGEPVTIPENCVLEFDGGGLSNGNVVFDNTTIKALPISIFDGVTISGTVRNTVMYAEWMGDISDNDCTSQLQSIIDFLSENDGGTLALQNAKYNITSLNLKHKVNIVGQGKGVSILYSDVNDGESKGIINIPAECAENNIENLSIVGNAVRGDGTINGIYYENLYNKPSTGNNNSPVFRAFMF